MPSVTLKRLNVTGVEYVVVDEDSPLLPQRSGDSQAANSQERAPTTSSDTTNIMTRRNAIIIGIVIACTVSVFGLIPTRHFYWSPFVTNRGGPSLSQTTTSAQDDNTPPAFVRARVRVPEDRPNFPSFWNFAPHGPINVTFDERAIILNRTRALFLSGSLHPVRATRDTWSAALDDAVRQGLNMVTIYVFWSAHQPFPNMEFDWSFPPGNWDLATAIRAAANRGLFCHIRIGPYVCAEYSYGGIPEWLPLNQPNMVMRRLNQEWLDAMETFVVEIVEYLTNEKLWAYQGGPIVMSQIENELGGQEDATLNARLLKVETPEAVLRPATIQDYADWCGNLGARVAPQVLWTMCNGLTAPNAINTCNGYGGTGCSTTWLEEHGQTGRIQVDQPALWTENEQGFQIWGEEPTNPSDYFWGATARGVAREGLQWFARGGSHLNYYMWWGSYNRGRAAASGITNMYASDACLCSSGQERQPKYGHLHDFHEAITTVAPILMSTDSALNNAQTVEYRADDGSWKVATKQRMFVYKGETGKEVVFIENDAGTNVEVRFPVSRTKSKQIIEVKPFSAALLVDGTLIFDSASINPRHKWYRRNTVAKAVKLLDWQTWEEQIGADAKDERTIVSSAPIEQTRLMIDSQTYSDYAWYETDVDLDEKLTNVTILIETQKANAMSLFMDGHFVGTVENHEHAEGSISLSIPVGRVLAGKHKLSFLSESLGYFNLIGRWGASTKTKTKGITGDVVILGVVGESPSHRFLVDGREWRSFPGLHGEQQERKMSSSQDRQAQTSNATLSPPCSWSSVLFDTPNYDTVIQGLFLDITSGRGHTWLNGFDLGRYWNITRGESERYSQRYYALPNELLYNNGTLNKLVIFKALGGDNSKTDLVLSWLEMDEDSSLEDEVDFPSACL